ncbi:peptidase inhibitor family I36 protein [Streptomyces sp. TRM70350]|uniref:peptidase inhibitor family I36 protein n=1 Tax=Streptomyces sp. TRM70350 TaxID=2856165 RepID=UPI001C47DA9A|nr:peptidase inhibitor family I36 protein [Streptomyces sp. TRM70350]MBV7698449.1 peptidase inhibitor family I36 protein [Streptomyces sp. TRM70350]
MRRRIAAAIGSAALVGATAFGFAQSATAAEAGPQATHFWLFQHDNYGGSSKNFSGDDRDLSDTFWNGTTSRVDNGASSMKNQTSRDVVLYQNVGCSGDNYFARANSVDGDFSNNGFDNRASCVDFR